MPSAKPRDARAAARPRRLEGFFADAAVVLAIALFESILLLGNARQRFEFFDMSAFLDAGYRVARGQAIYTDFYYQAGPVHPYMHALFFRLLGFNQTAILAHLLVVAIAVTVVLHAIARAYLPLPAAALVGVLNAVAFYGSIAHPWYDQNAAFFVVLALGAWELAVRSARRRAGQIAAVAIGFLLGLSFLAKANVGAAGGVLFLCVWLARPDGTRLIGGAVAGGILCALLWGSVIEDPAAFLWQAFRAFAPQGRLTHWQRLGETFSQTPYPIPLALGAVAAFAGGRDFIRREAAIAGAFAGLLFMSFFCAWTGSMLLHADTVYLGFDFLYLLALVTRLPPKVRFPSLRPLTAVATGLGFAFSFAHAAEASRNIEVWTWNPHVQVSDYALETPGFQGWLCNRRIGEGLDRTVEFIRSHVPPDESLIVLPDVTMIYGMTAREPYVVAPFILLENDVLDARLRSAFRSHFIRRPPTWIVLHDQRWHVMPPMTLLPILRWLGLGEFIQQRYEPVWRYDDFTVGRLRDRGPRSGA